MATVEFGDFEWGDEKAASNLEKHRVSFEEAATAVVDPRALFFQDRSAAEERFRVVGLSASTRVLLVVLVERGERDRIISAREASRAERSLYQEEP